jgi:hypothetical protein
MPQSKVDLKPFDFWSEADDDAATREGWILTNDSNNRVHIARLDDPAGAICNPPLNFHEPKFVSDDAALEHVGEYASRGSILHLKALFLAGHPIDGPVWFLEAPSIGIREPNVYEWPDKTGLWKCRGQFYWAEQYKSDDEFKVRAVQHSYSPTGDDRRWIVRRDSPRTRWTPVYVADDIPRNLSGNYPVETGKD